MSLSLWADAEGPDDQRDALDKKQCAKHERDCERRSNRRTQQKDANDEIEDAENEVPEPTPRETTDNGQDADDDAKHTEINNECCGQNYRRKERMVQNQEARRDAEQAHEDRKG